MLLTAVSCSNKLSKVLDVQQARSTAAENDHVDGQGAASPGGGATQSRLQGCCGQAGVMCCAATAVLHVLLQVP